MFHFGTAGYPEEVWSVLTTPASIRRFLFGVSLESTWAAGAPVTGWLDGASVMSGEVLYAERPNRLSYVLASGPMQPEVYVTWELRACRTGSVVRLRVVESDDSDNEELEAVWHPVVTALQSLLSMERS